MKGILPKKVNVWVLVSCILAILLIASVVYICAVKYREARENERLSIYRLGVQTGYEQAVLRVLSDAKDCGLVNVFSGNESMQLVDMNCMGSIK